ncbi:MAG: molybdenum ABC transporter ATP-binding protein [Rhodocyclaceae bacterium]|nr:molybdenum ABC transporter ATP-binding protein [Rhodocyclaceae bacterium]
MIEADFTLSLPGFELEARLELPIHGVTALFGPSGSGKSTLLRCLAGLSRPQRGRLVVNGEVWQDEGCFLPPHKRPVGMVFQDAALFPHLNVRQNLDYGAGRAKRGGKTKNVPKADDLIDLLGIGHLLDRRTGMLSGGEKQRVAIARALFSSPELLLLDEPLAALDGARKGELLLYLDQLHRQLDIPVVYVSHAPEEVARLADHIVQLKEGRVQNFGPVMGIFPYLQQPQTHEEGVFTLLAGTIELHDSNDHLTQVSVGEHRLWVRYIDRPVGSPMRLRLLARDVSLSLDPGARESSILNTLRAEVAGVEETAPGRALVRLALRDGPELLSRITTRSARNLKLEIGQTIYAQIKGVAPLE